MSRFVRVHVNTVPKYDQTQDKALTWDTKVPVNAWEMDSWLKVMAAISKQQTSNATGCHIHKATCHYLKRDSNDRQAVKLNTLALSQMPNLALPEGREELVAIFSFQVIINSQLSNKAIHAKALGPETAAFKCGVELANQGLTPP